MAQLSDYVVFADKRLEQRFAHGSVPMETLHEAYIDGALDIPDLGAFLDARDELVDFTITKGHVRFLVTRMLPEWLIHSKAQDQRIVRDHYDRGDDFFEAFLGDSMIYTSGIFHDDTESLEDAQRNKMNVVCQKLRLDPSHSLLDIGCGWGTLVAHAAREFGADATGITLAKTGAAFGNARIAQRGVAERARILCLDYREIPAQKYDRIVSLEMVEHVGVKNLARYFDVVRERLHDDGLFLLQWCGLRRGGPLGVRPVGMRPEDMVWGLFMNKYIFPGADASLPLSEMTKAMEKGRLRHSLGRKRQRALRAHAPALAAKLASEPRPRHHQLRRALVSPVELVLGLVVAHRPARLVRMLSDGRPQELGRLQSPLFVGCRRQRQQGLRCRRFGVTPREIWTTSATGSRSSANDARSLAQRQTSCSVPACVGG